MKNIAILSTSLANGGAERFVLNLRQLLLNLNYNVHVVLVSDVVDFSIDFDYVSLDNERTNHFSFLKPLVLDRFLKNNNIHIVIDNRTISTLSKAYVYSLVLRKYKVIKMVHNYKIDRYLFDSLSYNKLCFNSVDAFVGVSNQIALRVKTIFRDKKVLSIYNSIPDLPQLICKHKESYILYYGRLEEKSKNISFIIRCYQKSNLSSQGIKLFLLGDGPDLHNYQTLVEHLGLKEKVVFLPKMNQPFAMVQAALFTVMASHYEGFPMTLVESLALGTPVVTTNFKSGPEEIVIDRFNGLLVASEEKQLIEAFNELTENRELYAYCKSNAKQSVQHLQPLSIQIEWGKLIESL